MDISGIQAIVAGSNTRITWALSILGGSLIALLSTSYVRPMNKWSRLIYVIFIPGWIYLANSIRLGDCIVRRGIAATLNPERISVIESKMNDEFACQLNNFNLGLLFFGVWLLLYLMWWLLNDFFIKPKIT